MIPMHETLKIACIQQALAESMAACLDKSKQAIASACEQGAQLVCLQEMHPHPYFCQVEDHDHFALAESIPGPTTEYFSAIAKQHRVVLVLSLFEKRAKGLYHNTAVIIDSDGTIAGKYRKMHIPDDPGFHEKYYFTPGDPDGFVPIDTSIGRLGVLVCWDQWFPEAARLMTLAGADCLIYPTAIGWDSEDTPEEQARQLHAWQLIQRAHAVANQIPVIVTNRVGTEKSASSGTGIQFWGNSFIAGQQGEILAQADVSDEEVLIAQVQLNRTETLRQIWPYLRDRRIDAYDALLQRWHSK